MKNVENEPLKRGKRRDMKREERRKEMRKEVKNAENDQWKRKRKRRERKREKYSRSELKTKESQGVGCTHSATTLQALHSRATSLRSLPKPLCQTPLPG